MQVRQNSSGRVQPVEGKYLAHPGTCIICSRPPANPEEMWAYLGVEFDIDSSAYMCLGCCAEIADFIQFIDPVKHQRVIDESLVVQAKNHGLQKQVEYLKGLLNARIDTASISEPDSNGANDLPLFETDEPADEVDRILDEYQSKSA